MCARFHIKSICSIIFFIQIYYCDGRVLCKDPFATGWMSVGYSCPLKCSNILAAIEKLKVIDYSHVMERETLNTKIKIEGMNDENNKVFSDEKDKKLKNKESIYTRVQKGGNKDVHKYDAFFDVMKRHLFLRSGNNSVDATQSNSSCDSILQNKNIKKSARKKLMMLCTRRPLIQFDPHLIGVITSVLNQFHYRSGNSSGDATPSNSPCDSILQNKNIKKSARKKLMMLCTRRDLMQFDPHLVGIITSVLNQYTEPGYEFNHEMVAMLLNRTLAGTWGAPFAVRDINTILRQLTSEIQLLKEESNTIVRLASKHCLNIYVPGCYCRIGYVEHHSMCVLPEKCIFDEGQQKYLSRLEFY